MTNATTPVRFGIIGTGGIASDFTRDLALLPEADVVAVGSRQQSSADALEARFQSPDGRLLGFALLGGATSRRQAFAALVPGLLT